MKKSTIGILTFPISKAGNTPLIKLVSVIKYNSDKICLITGNEVSESLLNDNSLYVHKLSHKHNKNAFIRILNYILTQFKLSYILYKSRKTTDTWIFFIGGDTLLLPMIILKLLDKKIILVFPGSSVQTLIASNDLLYLPLTLLSNINCQLADRIVLYSNNHITEWHLTKYRKKILVGSQHYVDTSKYNIVNSYNKRDKIIAYVGRLSEEKGIMNFILAIPEIIKYEKDIKILIIGNGNLKETIEKFIKENNLTSYVELTGWISQEELPKYINLLKLLILPSYTEGLPNVILESMACGTPVLSTPVGAIRDIINDCENGFIMNNNDPSTIATNIIKSLNHKNLEIIANNGYTFVTTEYTFNNAVKKWEKILLSMNSFN